MGLGKAEGGSNPPGGTTVESFSTCWRWHGYFSYLEPGTWHQRFRERRGSWVVQGLTFVHKYVDVQICVGAWAENDRRYVDASSCEDAEVFVEN